MLIMMIIRVSWVPGIPHTCFRPCNWVWLWHVLATQWNQSWSVRLGCRRDASCLFALVCRQSGESHSCLYLLLREWARHSLALAPWATSSWRNRSLFRRGPELLLVRWICPRPKGSSRGMYLWFIFPKGLRSRWPVRLISTATSPSSSLHIMLHLLTSTPVGDSSAQSWTPGLYPSRYESRPVPCLFLRYLEKEKTVRFA